MSILDQFTSFKSFEDFLEEWKLRSTEERCHIRDEINSKTLLDQLIELAPEENSFRRLTRGSFLIARVLWDSSGQKSHDHLCFVEWVHGHSIRMVFITDLFESCSVSKCLTWDIRQLNVEVQRGTLKFVKLTFGGYADDPELVLQRAKAYRLPEEGQAKPLHFAYVSAFGLKEPIYSKEHLSLCEKNTLLLVRNEVREEKLLILAEVDLLQRDQFHIITDAMNVRETLSYEQILKNIGGSNGCFLYYYPSVKIKGGSGVLKQGSKIKHEALHGAVEVGAIHAAEHGVKHVLAKHGVRFLAPELAGAASHIFGGAIHGAVASIGAAVVTNNVRKEENMARTTHG